MQSFQNLSETCAARLFMAISVTVSAYDVKFAFHMSGTLGDRVLRHFPLLRYLNILSEWIEPVFGITFLNSGRHILFCVLFILLLRAERDLFQAQIAFQLFYLRILIIKPIMVPMKY